MWIAACKTCRLVVEACENPEDFDEELLLGARSDHASRGYPCPDCKEPLGLLTLADAAGPALAGFSRRAVTAHEAFLWLEDMGFPEERAFTPESVAASLGGGVLRVGVKGVGESCVVDYIDCKDGTTLFLAASSCGATIYRHRGDRSARTLLQRPEHLLRAHRQGVRHVRQRERDLEARRRPARGGRGARDGAGGPAARGGVAAQHGRARHPLVAQGCA